MQTLRQIGQGNALEALDQAPGLMEREPDYYRSVGDVLESYATNALQTDGVTDENAGEVERGFMDALKSRGVEYVPHGMTA